MLALLAGPSIAGLIMTGVADCRSGYHALVSHLLRWRVGAHWYALARSSPLQSCTWLPHFRSRALRLISLPSIVATSDKAAMLVMGLAYGLLGGGFLEELGWTGLPCLGWEISSGRIAG
jgi:hypothetical protein